MGLLDVSIIIVNWNTCDTLQDSLKSIYEQTCDIAVKVFIVDRTSSDGLTEMVRAEFAK